MGHVDKDKLRDHLMACREIAQERMQADVTTAMDNLLAELDAGELDEEG